VLLLDEPLSALDAHTRTEVREQLADVLAELALPTLMVTHDFTDAAALAQRVGVVLDGRLHQLGTPPELLARPADRFVASLTGGNLLTGHARPLDTGGSEVRLDTGAAIRTIEREDGRVGVAIHPWDIRIEHEAPADGANTLPGTIGAITLHGGRSRVRIGELLAELRVDDTAVLERGTTANAVFAPEHVRLIPLDQPASDQEDP
jgi:molybdate transport system ATP-binding protein